MTTHDEMVQITQSQLRGLLMGIADSAYMLDEAHDTANTIRRLLEKSIPEENWKDLDGIAARLLSGMLERDLETNASLTGKTSRSLRSELEGLAWPDKYAENGSTAQAEQVAAETAG